VNIESRVT